MSDDTDIIYNNNDTPLFLLGEGSEFPMPKRSWCQQSHTNLSVPLLSSPPSPQKKPPQPKKQVELELMGGLLSV